MKLTEIRKLVDEAQRRARDGTLGYLVIGYASSDAGEASGHQVVARCDDRAEAEERAGGHHDNAYVLDEEELAAGFTPMLLSLAEAAQASGPRAGAVTAPPASTESTLG